MALVIFTPKIEPGVGGWLFDVTRTETLNSKATVTSYGVEEGSDITDHVRLEPRTFSLSGIVTATPLDPEKTFPDRLQDVINDLLNLQKAEQTYELVTVFGIIPNVVITSVSATYDVASSGDVLSIELELKEVRFARAQTVRIVEVNVSEKVAKDLSDVTVGDAQIDESGVVSLGKVDRAVLTRGTDPIKEQQKQQVRAYRAELDKKVFDNPELTDSQKKNMYVEAQNNDSLREAGVFDDSVVDSRYDPLGIDFEPINQ